MCINFSYRFSKKTPYAKPIPKTFQAAWNAAGGLEDEVEEENSAVCDDPYSSLSVVC